MKTVVSISVLFLFMCASYSCSAQFTYVESTLGFYATNLKDEQYSNGNQLRSFSLSVTGVRRFMRPFGIGLDLEIPFSQKYTPIDDLVGISSVDNYGYNSWSSYPSGTRPNLDYQVRRNIVPRALFRVYFGDGISDFYCEARFAVSSIQEKLHVTRDVVTLPEGVVLPELDINYKSNVAYTLGGFAVGYQSTNDKSWFFKIRTGFDILMYDRSDMRISFPVDVESDELVELEIRSTLVENSTLWFCEIGAGYFF